MEKILHDEMMSAARENGNKHGKCAELDFGAGAEWMYDKLTSKAKESPATADKQSNQCSLCVNQIVSCVCDKIGADCKFSPR